MVSLDDVAGVGEGDNAMLECMSVFLKSESERLRFASLYRGVVVAKFP